MKNRIFHTQDLCLRTNLRCAKDSARIENKMKVADMSKIEVILAKSAGFCFGVHRAVDTVYERTDKENVYTYGPIIHNEVVVQDLEEKGVKVLNTKEELATLTDGIVVIRSHGVGKEIYEMVQNNSILKLIYDCNPIMRLAVKSVLRFLVTISQKFFS